MRPKSPHGFSVIELLIVVAAAGILLSFAVPQLRESLSASRLQSTAVQLSSELAFARTMAVSRNGIFEVRLNPGQRTYQIVDPADPQNAPRTPKRLDQGITFGGGTPGAVRFFPRGHAAASQVSLRDEFGRQIDVAISSSGRVEVSDFRMAETYEY